MPTTPQRRQAVPYVPSILIVDDDPRIRASFRKILEEAGYLVADASTGREASKAAIEWFFEVMILDLSMPHEDGFEVIRSVRGHAPGLKILVVSEFMAGRMLPVAAKLGAHATMHKAEASDRLLPTICRLMEQPA
jgi:two-component system response regulator HydG